MMKEMIRGTRVHGLLIHLDIGCDLKWPVVRYCKPYLLVRRVTCLLEITKTRFILYGRDKTKSKEFSYIYEQPTPLNVQRSTNSEIDALTMMHRRSVWQLDSCKTAIRINLARHLAALVFVSGGFPNFQWECSCLRH